MHAGWQDAFLRYLTDAAALAAHRRGLRAGRQPIVDFLAGRWGDERAYDWAGVDYRIIRAFLADLSRQHYAKSSIARKLAALRALFRFLLQEGAVTANPAKLAPTPKQDERLPEYLYADEMEVLLSTPDEATALGQRDRAILELLYATGVRVSELVAMDVSEINFEERSIRVIGWQPERVVLMGERAAQALRRYLADGREQLLRAGTSPDREAVFLNKAGGGCRYVGCNNG